MLACNPKTDKQEASSLERIAHNFPHSVQQNKSLIVPNEKNVSTRFKPPDGFERTTASENTFTSFLRELPLKPDGSKVKCYDGKAKPNHGVYVAVVDLEIGNKDLHQCADAVMRLWAEYLWEQKQFDKIHFNFTNGFRVNYTEWMQGKRIVVKGNKSYWSDGASPSNTYKDFWDYLETIFMYAGTLSLSKELKSVDIDDLKIGDVFIQGGSPGHAVIVVDMAINPITQKKFFLLAQSYMPAQEIQILKNPNNSKISPWYPSNFGDILRTPEWTFRKGDLKRFGNE
ncbi:MAG: DUF4846 domain-containing protein [Chlorobi bacterium]|nr:DUF4846 domain-containing protein [Chlorobiota bacterium]